MIRFLAKIRQKLIKKNQIGRYVLYAIGEIFLIVFGILIALQINNWNESNKLKNKEYNILLNLKSDFESNMKLIDSGLIDFQYDLAYQKAAIRYTGPYVGIPKNAELDSVSNINFSTVELIYGSINPIYNPNRIDLLINENLRGKIADFMVALIKYKEGETLAKELALELRGIHQHYVWLIDGIDKPIGINKNNNLSRVSDYVGWLQDRNHQNVAVDRTGAINNCIRQLTSLQTQIISILSLIENEFKRF